MFLLSAFDAEPDHSLVDTGQIHPEDVRFLIWASDDHVIAWCDWLPLISAANPRPDTRLCFYANSTSQNQRRLTFKFFLWKRKRTPAIRSRHQWSLLSVESSLSKTDRFIKKNQNVTLMNKNQLKEVSSESTKFLVSFFTNSWTKRLSRFTNDSMRWQASPPCPSTSNITMGKGKTILNYVGVTLHAVRTFLPEFNLCFAFGKC